MTETQELIRHLGTFSYFGIFGISILANIVIPVPEEVVLLALGYVAGTGRINALIVIPIVISGLLLSDIAMFILSRKGNKWILLFYNRFFARRLESRRAWLQRHIKKVIFFSRFLVQLRFLGPFMAGQEKVSWRDFITYELAALIIYVPFLIWAGGFFQNRIEDVISGIGIVRNIILLCIGLLILVSLSRFIYKYLFSKTE